MGVVVVVPVGREVGDWMGLETGTLTSTGFVAAAVGIWGEIRDWMRLATRTLAAVVFESGSIGVRVPG